ncbi:MAG: nucleoside triphosphate pyrophosphatase [Gammaproteobacteria bacterium]|nr:nucleoside triphosphate pyrophosphatase [Gammaproteobacteria bacterium]
MYPIVLASSSPYRRTLLARLVGEFRVLAPQVEEQVRAGEPPTAMAARLAEAKAREVATRAPGCLVIGADQVAVLEDRILRKPGNAEVNRAQLLACAGRHVEFHTGLALIHADSGRAQTGTVLYTVRFRALGAAQIERYVAREQAFDCAGGFRCEGLGIALFASMHGDDPTALMGLPLIALTDMLAAEGVDVLAWQAPPAGA